MQRRVIRLPVADGRTLYKTVVETEECVVGTLESKILCFELLRSIIENPQIIDCGGHFFSELELKHDGAKWVLQAKTTKG